MSGKLLRFAHQNHDILMKSGPNGNGATTKRIVPQPQEPKLCKSIFGNLVK